MAVKKPKKLEEPLTRCDGTLTESAYLAFIRSTLRSKSLRWKPRSNALEKARRPYKGPNKRQKWEYLCGICKGYFKQDETHVDHFPHPCGSILSVEDIGNFAENLFCNSDNLRVLCVECHAIHTVSESHNLTFEEARKLKVIIDLLKPANKSKMEVLLKKHNYVCKNAVQRRAALTEIFDKESHD